MRLMFTLLFCMFAAVAQAEGVLAPFPYATIVAQGEEASKPREFVLSAVEQIRRETSIRRMVSVAATRQWLTYEVPIDTDPRKLKAHYAEQLGAQVLFQCEGRDCGRSNTWANQVFGQALLYGLDQEQAYFAAQVDGQLVSVYLIKRGNRRQYAHVEFWQPDVMPQFALVATDRAKWQQWWAGFSRVGFAVVPQVQPEANGELNNTALVVLASVAAEIPPRLSQNLQLVCHLYPNSRGRTGTAVMDITESIAASLRCAEDAASVFAEAGTTVVPRGVGPLAPDDTRSRSRLVLVDPTRLTH